MKINSVSNQNFGRCRLVDPLQMYKLISKSLPKQDLDVFTREIDGLVKYVHERTPFLSGYEVRLHNIPDSKCGLNLPSYFIELGKNERFLCSENIPYRPNSIQGNEPFNYEKSSELLAREVNKLKEMFSKSFLND